MHASVSALLLAALLVWAPDRAVAQQPGTHDHPDSVWYGWQTLIVDTAAVSMVTYGAIRDHDPLLWGGAAAFFAGGPLLHIAHGQSHRAFISFTVRTYPPVALGVIGGLASFLVQEQSAREALGRMTPGFVIGAALAIVIDARILAVKPGESPDPGTQGRLRTFVLPTRDGFVWLGAGRF